MVKLITLSLLLFIPVFIVGSTGHPLASAEALVTTTPTPIPEAVGNASCSSSDFLVVTTSSRVKPGSIITFEIKSDKPLQGQPIWSVSSGQIVSGQGTTKIQVLAPTDPESIPIAPMTFPDIGEHGYIFMGGIGPRKPHFEASFMSADTCFRPVRSRNIFLGDPQENQFANMLDLKLSVSELGLSCGNTGDELGPMAVSVKSLAFDEENDVLVYNYTVTGGQIKDKGANVIWDLSDVQPGIYEITAAVDDGCGLCGRTITKQVTIYGTCDGKTEPAFSCACPELTVEGGYDGVQPGDELGFYADLSDERIAVPVYNWTVENGKIISGQGTDEIKVLTDEKTKIGSVKATVKIPAYDTYCNCPTSASASVPFSESSYIVDINNFANVHDLILNETELTLPPEPGKRPFKGTKVSPDMLIDVTTEAIDPENDPIKYVYAVSGGRIIGNGPNVQWDLSGVQPGIYKITAGVDDGCGICGKTITKLVKVIECRVNPY